MWIRHTRVLALMFAVLLVSAACSGADSESDAQAVDDDATEESDHGEGSGQVDRVVEIELTDFVIEASSFEFVSGEVVEFVVTNSGAAKHEFRLSNQDRVDEHIAGGHEDHMDDDMDMDVDDDGHDDDGHDGAEAEDAVLSLDAGDSGTLVFTFPDNDHDYTVAACLIPGHYEAGMATDLSYTI